MTQNKLDEALRAAILDCNLSGIRIAINEGAKPNAEDAYGDCMLEDVFHESRK